MKTIYLRTKQPEKKAQIESLCEELGLGTKPLRAADLSRTVAEVTGIRLGGAIQELQSGDGGRLGGSRDGQQAQIPPLYAMPELLLFDGLEDETLDAFLEAYRARSIEPVALRAVVTPFNLRWTLYELIRELEKEREAYTAYPQQAKNNL